MALNSIWFLLLFFPIVVLGYRVVGSTHGRQLWLAAASIVFYALSGPRDLVLLLASIAFNSYIAKSLLRAPEAKKKSILTFGIVLNVSYLFVFKYLHFAVSSFAPWLPEMRIQWWSFPLGISFFSLQQIMYLFDCYEGLVVPHSFLNHVLFVSFFPSITAGPLTRARQMIPQFVSTARAAATSDDVSRGILMFSIGALKKTVLADSLVKLIDAGYSQPSTIGHVGAWVCSIAFSLQLYLDFSGYSDMAIGAARVLGIQLPKNFDAPFRARSISEFWQRWHITLSQFITTYLFTPMVKRPKGRVTVHRAAGATLIAMLVAGLWHGPSWNYVVFGGIHGVGLAANQYWKKYGPGKMPGWLAWLATMLVVNVGFVFFRLPTLGEATHVARMLIPFGASTPEMLAVNVRAQGLIAFAPIWLLAALVAGFGPTSNQMLASFYPTKRTAALVIAMLLSALLFMNSNLGRDFVYAAF